MAKGEIKAKVLAELPGTVKDLAKKLRMHECAVRDHLKNLAIAGKAHISKERPCRNREPGVTWSAGPPGPDAPPQPQYKTKKYKERADRLKKPDPVKEDATIARTRTTPASWLSALGG